MYTYLSSAQLKARSKEQLFGKYQTVIPAMLAISVIISVAVLPLTALLNSTWGFFIYYIAIFLLQLVTAVFAVGQIKLFTNIIRKQRYSLADIFFGFRFHADKTIIIQFILYLIYLIPSAFLLIATFVFVVFESIWVIPLITLSLIVYIILSIFIILIFSQAFYLVLENPNLSSIEILKKSAALMKGHKARLFYLSVSFIPISLLGILTCGIGMLWITPYMGMTSANFFLDLYEGDRQKQTIVTEPNMIGTNLSETIATENDMVESVVTKNDMARSVTTATDRSESVVMETNMPETITTDNSDKTETENDIDMGMNI